MRMRGLVARFMAAVGVVLCCSPARAQLPLGSEFRANTFTTSNQNNSSIAADVDGNFVIVWADGLQDLGFGVFGQRFSSSGAALGTEFRANSYTTGSQSTASVASDPSGDFLVVWASDGQDGDMIGIFGQRFSSSGARLGTEFRANTHTTNQQDQPSAASDGAGGFVVVWQSFAQVGVNNDIFGQRFSSSGATLGSEFHINTFTTFAQRQAVVASDANGNFVVAWSSNNQDGAFYGIFGQRFSSDGAMGGSEFRVNTYTTGSQTVPAVASDSAGGFVVAWASDGQDGDGLGVFAKRFSSGGAALGSEFVVNGYTTGVQTFRSAAADANGNFVLTWDDSSQDGDDIGVFAQAFASDGAAVGPVFLVNTYTTGQQNNSAVASGADGNFVIAWTGRGGQDGSSDGVFAQRFLTDLIFKDGF